MQLMIVVTIEVVVQSVNEYIGVFLLQGYDVGESMYVHVFGAYFGLAVAKVLNFRKVVESENEGESYQSNLFSMIGGFLSISLTILFFLLSSF
jgi:ammonium transporter Rh